MMTLNQYIIIASVITSITSHLLVVIMVATVIKKEWYSEMIYVPYVGNHSRKKTFSNFADFLMIVNVFLLPFSIL